jgi:N utilization substance protein B
MSAAVPGKPKNPHGARSSGRELALKFLYSADLSGHAGEEDFDLFVNQAKDRGRVVDFARQLVRGVVTRRAELDAHILKLAKNWTIKRMAVVDRNVLRLGIYELLFGDSPDLVVINEAVEIAKKFGSAQSGAFVNGILDQVRRRKDQ